MATADKQEMCGPGIRGVAMMIDSFVWVIGFFVFGSVVAWFTGDLETGTLSFSFDLDGGAAMAAITVSLAFGILYHTLFEWWTGKTLGKYLVKIHVSTDDGGSLSLGTSFSRNVLRLIDWLPFFYMIAIIFVARSGEKKRLGDRVGGTVVIRD